MTRRRLREVVRDAHPFSTIPNEITKVMPAVQTHLLKRLNLPPEVLASAIDSEEHRTRLAYARVLSKQGNGIPVKEALDIFRRMHRRLPAYASGIDNSEYRKLKGDLQSLIENLSNRRPVEIFFVSPEVLNLAKDINSHHLMELIGPKYGLYQRSLSRTSRIMQRRSRRV